MSFEEFNTVFRLLGSLGVGAIIGGGVTFLLLKSFIPSYLEKKAENLATKEDIEAITEKIEQVRSRYSELLEELKAKHQLRMAAIDKRLQVHQEAFTKWRKLYHSMHSPEVTSVVIECQSWWDQNCVYLEPEIRRAFADAFSAAGMHSSYLQGRDTNLIKENWEKIIRFPNLLFPSVQLPTLTSVEESAIFGDKSDTPQQR